MRISAFYFSGTGNTKYIVKCLKDIFSANKVIFDDYDIAECREDIADKICGSDVILFAFPVHCSRPPLIVSDFVTQYENVFLDKDILIAASQMKTSGDTAAFFARRMTKLGANVLIAEHFNMPNNVSDSLLLRIKNGADNASAVRKTEKKLERFFEEFNCGKKHIYGSDAVGRFIGSINRLFTAHFCKNMPTGLKINMSQCNFCRQCVKICPVGNIVVQNDKIQTIGRCTGCYRCVNGCEKKAISLLSKSKPKVQYKGIEYTKSKRR